MVQRCRICSFPVVRNCKRKSLSAFESARGQTRAPHQYRLLYICSYRHASAPPATVQHGLSRRVLAILHGDRFSADCRRVPVCAHDPSAARIELEASESLRDLLRRFGVVKAAVIHRQSAAAVLGIDFDKAVAESNIAPSVILLCLNRRCNHRIDSNNRY